MRRRKRMCVHFYALGRGRLPPAGNRPASTHPAHTASGEAPSLRPYINYLLSARRRRTHDRWSRCPQGDIRLLLPAASTRGCGQGKAPALRPGRVGMQEVGFGSNGARHLKRLARAVRFHARQQTQRRCVSASVIPATDRGDCPRPARVRTGQSAALRANGSRERRTLRRAGQSGERDPGGAAPAVDRRPCRSAVGPCSAGSS